MRGMAGSFAGHDRTQTKPQTAVSLLPTEETGAGMRTESTESEVRQRVGGFLLFKPAGVFPRAKAEQIRERPPLRAVYSARSGGDLDVDAPAFPRTPRRGTEQRRQTRAHVNPRVSVRSQTVRAQLAVPSGFPKGVSRRRHRR